MMKKRACLLAACGAVLLLAVTFLLYWQEDTADLTSILSHIEGEAIRCSRDSGFYDDAVTVALTPDRNLPSSVQICYTLNGDDPQSGGELYTEPLQLTSAGEEPSVYPLKAAICYKGEYGQTMERTYVVGEDVSFTMPVISITVPDSALWDEETGIFANCTETGDEWERQAHVVIFDQDGAVVADQGVGLAVAGWTSRLNHIKSLKLNADCVYDAEHDKLKLQLFNDDLSELEWTFDDEYGSVKLRSGSQDYMTGGNNIRQRLGCRLAEQSRFNGFTPSKKCVVFLNGTYYCVADMMLPYSQSYMADRYDLPESDKVTVISATEREALEATGLDALFVQDLNQPENRAALEAAVDMDNYFLYYAIEILLNNTDWPQNNYDMWRYEGVEEANNPYSDGKYRYCIHDLDLIYYTEENIEIFEGATSDTFQSIMDNTHRGFDCSLRDVLQVKEYRDRFIVILCDLMNTSFRTEHVLDVLEQEYTNYLQEWLRWVQKDDEFLALQLNQYKLITKAISQRNDEIREDLRIYFDMEEQYDLTLHNDEGILLTWNQMQVFSGETYTCPYYCGTAHEITATEYPGYAFCYWLVNGERREDRTLVVDDSLIRDGKVEIRAVARPLEEGVPVIERISAGGDADWVVVGNAGAAALRLEQFYLTDDGANLKKYQLPQRTLQPGETLRIYCKGSSFILGEYQCNFNLNDQETLLLTDGTDVLDALPVPKMGAHESYGRHEGSPVMKFYRDTVDTEDAEQEARPSVTELLLSVGSGLGGNCMTTGRRRSGPLKSNAVYSQFFVAEASECTGVMFSFANYSYTNQCGVKVQILDPLTNEVIADEYLPADQIRDNYSTLFPLCASLVPGCQYELRLTPDEGECKLLLYLTDEGTATQATYAVLDGEVQESCFRMVMLYKDLSF
ncbi:MAG: CotH kinase family protein [Aristaeellaceae bacterium]